MTRSTPMLAVLALMAVASTAGAGVVVDHDHDADFSGFETFTFKSGTPASSELNQRRIENAIERELVAKGLRRDDEAPDLEVVTHVSVEKSMRVEVDDFGYQRHWGGTTVSAYEVHLGTLVVDLVDASKKALAWRGKATATVDPNMKPDKLEARINKIVAKMFKEYPPS